MTNEQEDEWRPKIYLSDVCTPAIAAAFCESWGFKPDADLWEQAAIVSLVQRIDLLHPCLDEHQRERVRGYLSAARANPETAITPADEPFILGVWVQAMSALGQLRPPTATVLDFETRAMAAHATADQERLMRSPYYEVEAGRLVWAFTRDLERIEARLWGVDRAACGLAVAADTHDGVRAIIPRIAGALPTDPREIAKRIAEHGRRVACSFEGRALDLGGAA